MVLLLSNGLDHKTQFIDLRHADDCQLDLKEIEFDDSPLSSVPDRLQPCPDPVSWMTSTCTLPPAASLLSHNHKLT